jgi:hypothetical protein
MLRLLTVCVLVLVSTTGCSDLMDEFLHGKNELTSDDLVNFEYRCMTRRVSQENVSGCMFITSYATRAVNKSGYKRSCVLDSLNSWTNPSQVFVADRLRHCRSG